MITCVNALALITSLTAGSIDEINIEFEDGAAVLRGMVFLPDGDGESPGVIILGGSERGPQTQMKRRLGQHFAEAGVAALIYDSPGTGDSTGNAMFQTREDRATEALAAVKCLRGQPRVRDEDVGIMGISEGAIITMLAAARDDSIAFVIPVSGAFGVPMLEQARYRIEVQGLPRGLSAEQLQRANLLMEILFALFVGPAHFEQRLMQMKAEQWPDEPWAELITCVTALGESASQVEQEENWETLKQALSTWRAEPWFDLVVVLPDRFDRLISSTAAQFEMFIEHGTAGARRLRQGAR